MPGGGLTPPLRVGVVGCGLIAQVMHLPYLVELEGRYAVTALCDISEPVLEACSRRYAGERTFTNFEELLGEPPDAVLGLTEGDHAPLAIAAAQAGLHVFVEKPMAVSAAQGAAMLDAARVAEVRLMVGTMKRYDPAYERLVELASGGSDVRLVRVTTLESPLEPYVAHLPLVRADDSEANVARVAARRDAEHHIDAALGSDADEELRWCYRNVLLDNLV